MPVAVIVEKPSWHCAVSLSEKASKDSLQKAVALNAASTADIPSMCLARCLPTNKLRWKLVTACIHVNVRAVRCRKQNVMCKDSLQKAVAFNATRTADITSMFLARAASQRKNLCWKLVTACIHVYVRATRLELLDVENKMLSARTLYST